MSGPMLQLAITAHRENRYSEAERLYIKVLRGSPNNPEAIHGLGFLYYHMGRLDEAEKQISLAILRAGDVPRYHNNLGEVLRAARKTMAAEGAYRRALSLDARYAIGWNNLGILLSTQKNRHTEAIECFERCLSLRSDLPEPYANRADLLHLHGHIGAAMKSYQSALALRPTYAKALAGLAYCHGDRGDSAITVELLRKAVELDPNNRDIRSQLVLLMMFDPASRGDPLIRERKIWAERFGYALDNSLATHANDRNPDRRLRIGYVCADFSDDHPVSRLINPLLANHDHSAVEVACYSEKVLDPAPATSRLCEHWIETRDLNDEALAARIRDDRIDILIDLSLHMRGTRLAVFGKRPAPVQMTYLGYCDSTGMPAMDYLVTDNLLHPPESSRFAGPERLLRLPDCYWVYSAPPFAPPIGPLPAERRGYITFGLFNYFTKVNPQIISTWAGILRSIPNARLLVVMHGGADLREHVQSLFGVHGIRSDRIEVRDRQPLDQHLELYQEVDICLDPFPYNGGTTTLDSLYMGVPVITIAGDDGMARAGVTILNAIGHSEFIAKSTAEYESLAVRLASDRTTLAEIHSTLRDKLASSCIMNQTKFAKAFETMLRGAWRAWCEPSTP